jgi:hypothetical protein
MLEPVTGATGPAMALFVAYELNSKDINDRIAKSKYRYNPNFARSTSGHIMFQHHGQKSVAGEH